MDQVNLYGMVFAWLPMLLVQSIVWFVVIYAAVRLAIRHERAHHMR